MSREHEKTEEILVAVRDGKTIREIVAELDIDHNIIRRTCKRLGLRAPATGRCVDCEVPIYGPRKRCSPCADKEIDRRRAEARAQV